MFCCSWVATCKFENHIDDWIQASTSYSFQLLMSKVAGVAPNCTIFSNCRLFLNRLPFNAHCPFNISIARSYYMNFITLNASTYKLNVHRLYTMHITHTRFKWGLSLDNFLQAGEWVPKGVLSKLNQVGEWLRSNEGKHKKIYGCKGRRWTNCIR